MKYTHRDHYFDINVHNQKIKDCISGKNEIKVLEVLQYLGYKINQDFVRQHPIGNKFVCDFAFINEQIVIEIDGDSHNKKKIKKMDELRDRFFYENGWVVIRIKDKEFFGFKLLFYKNLIKEVVEERREQYNSGNLYSIDMPDFNEKNYE